MTDDNGAKARLETAVQRLETALGQVIERGSSDTDDFSRLRQEISALDSQLTATRAEWDRLAAELETAKAEGAALQSAMDAVSGRLDQAIASVHTLLDD